jgi:type IX secretion system PorP/SprF family membrane protein
MLRSLLLNTGLLLLLMQGLNAQVDPHFSQFYANPMWLNPGMTGVMDGGERITAIYRNQWSAVMTPFTTTGISADINTTKNINLGANILSQSAGDAGYQYLNAGLSVAYSGVRFGKDNTQQITIGIQAGMLSRRFDPSRFQFGDQWNAVTGYDPGVISPDQLTKTSATVFDAGVGLSYFDGDPDKKVSFYGGLAAFHLTRPQDPFINSSVKKYLPVRSVVHGGARISLGENLSLTPNLLYMRQGEAREWMIGFFGQMRANESTDLLWGANIRPGDAVSPYLGVAFQQFMLGASYDVTISDLGKAVPGTNSIEVSLTYIGRKSGKPLRYLSCPRF